MIDNAIKTAMRGFYYRILGIIITVAHRERLSKKILIRQKTEINLTVLDPPIALSMST